MAQAIAKEKSFPDGKLFFISSNACAVTRHFPAEYARYRRGWLVSWLGFNLTPVFPSVPGQ